MVSENQFRANLQQVMELRKLNANNLCGGDLNLSRKIYNQIVKKKTVSLDVIAVILNAVPDLNTEWLFRSVGTMFKDKHSVDERITSLEQRLSVMEGERENAIPDDCSNVSHTA